MPPVLDVQDLATNYITERRRVKGAERCNLKGSGGEALGITGEAGSGKTTVGPSLLKILPKNGRIRKGKILFEGQDIVAMSEGDMRKKIRWDGIAIIFQGAMNAFNPVYKVGDQIVEAILAHEEGVDKKTALERARDLFQMVGVEPERVDNYPHEFSGGMRQRALIAMALAANPKLVVADEPGTALDVIVQAQVLKLMRELKDRLNLSMVLISHDLSIIAETCEKVAIMYAGRIVEYGNAEDIYNEPLHPYTQGLIKAFPSIKGARTRLVSIPGQPPDLLKPPTGCRFNPRCPYVMDACRKEVPLLDKAGNEDHLVACHLY